MLSCCLSTTATRSEQVIAHNCVCRSLTKVGQLYAAVLFQQQVGAFDITVDSPLRVKVGQAWLQGVA